MTYELRRKIELPAYIDGAFPSDSLKRVITRSSLIELTKRELRIVKSEISETILAIDRDLEVAKTRAALPPESRNYKSMNESWRTRAKRMRECLLFLFHEISRELIRRSESPDGLSTYEVEAEQLVSRHNKRDRRQRFLVQAFVDLVAEELGSHKLDELLRKAATLADADCEARLPAPPLVPSRFFDDE